MKKGLFCKVCVLFAPNEVGGIKLDRLVKAPLQKFAHLTGRDGYLTNHLSNVFHEDCVRRANEFKLSLQNGNGDIAKQLQCSAAIQCAQKREALKHILQAIEFLGRLGLPLRGHRDSGTINLTASSSNDLDYSQGNFRALLQLMACNDEILRNHLQTSSKNATYISPESQNQLIAAISTVCVRQIVNEVKEAKFFSLLADETTDFSQFFRRETIICTQIQGVQPELTNQLIPLDMDVFRFIAVKAKKEKSVWARDSLYRRHNRSTSKPHSHTTYYFIN